MIFVLGENWWAVEDTSGPRQDLDYVKCVTDHYRAFWECGLDVEFCKYGR